MSLELAAMRWLWLDKNCHVVLEQRTPLYGMGQPDVIGERIGMTFGKPLTHAEAVRIHALGLKKHLEELAIIAGEQEEMQNEIRKFFAEAFANLFQIMALCNQRLPAGDLNNEVEIRFQTICMETTPAGRHSSAVSGGNTEMLASKRA